MAISYDGSIERASLKHLVASSYVLFLNRHTPRLFQAFSRHGLALTDSNRRCSASSRFPWESWMVPELYESTTLAPALSLRVLPFPLCSPFILPSLGDILIVDLEKDVRRLSLLRGFPGRNATSDDIKRLFQESHLSLGFWESRMITYILCWKGYVEPLATVQLCVGEPPVFQGKTLTELEQGTLRGEPALYAGAWTVSDVKHRVQGVEGESLSYTKESVLRGTGSPECDYTPLRIETRIAEKLLGRIGFMVSQRSQWAAIGTSFMSFPNRIVCASSLNAPSTFSPVLALVKTAGEAKLIEDSVTSDLSISN